MKPGPAAKVLPVIVTAAAIALTGCGGSDEPAATFTGEVLQMQVVNPATLKVKLEISNTSDVVGDKPECTLHASDPSGAYEGTEWAYASERVPPGESKWMWVTMTIEDEGAQYVTRVKADC